MESSFGTEDRGENRKLKLHQANLDREFDVCLSFAGEQRVLVEEVADHLRSAGIRVFYDRFEEVNLWGKNLVETLDWQYRRGARWCVLFVSSDYARKAWTNHERRSAQARALQESGEYVLPARFDDTEIPGLLPTVSYLDLRKLTPQAVAELIKQKVRPDFWTCWNQASRNPQGAFRSFLRRVVVGIPVQARISTFSICKQFWS